MTTDTSYISPASVNSKPKSVITKVILKNGTQINCKDKKVKFEETFGNEKFIVISYNKNTDSVKIGEDRYSIKVKVIEDRISMNDISKIEIEESRFSTGKTLLITGGVFVLLMIVFAIGIGTTMEKGFKFGN